MITYLKNVIEQFPEEISGRALSPAAEHLIAVRDKSKARVLEEERALAFHHTVAHLLCNSRFSFKQTLHSANGGPTTSSVTLSNKDKSSLSYQQCKATLTLGKTR
jgi:hypothetical protein